MVLFGGAGVGIMVFLVGDGILSGVVGGGCLSLGMEHFERLLLD